MESKGHVPKAVPKNIQLLVYFEGWNFMYSHSSGLVHLLINYATNKLCQNHSSNTHKYYDLAVAFSRLGYSRHFQRMQYVISAFASAFKDLETVRLILHVCFVMLVSRTVCAGWATACNANHLFFSHRPMERM